MFHCFVTPDAIGDTDVCITGSDVNHIKNVLRMKEGDDIYVSDGQGRSVLASIASLSDDEVTAHIVSVNAGDTELCTEIVLYQALPKSDKMEMIIQKCTELGVARIVPVETSRCIVRLDGKKAGSKVERWQKIAQSAAEQSQRAVIPEITRVMSFREALEDCRDCDIKVIPYEHCKDNETLKELFAACIRAGRIGIFIGPEGGFTIEEVDEAIAAGVMPVSLGRRILRTETAGMALIAALMLKLEILF